MRNTMMNPLVFAAATFVSSAAIVSAQDVQGWDQNSDGSLDKSEFEQALSDRGIWEAWDVNGDGSIGEDEFSQGVFAGYDEDTSGVIEDEERELYEFGMAEGGLWGSEDYGNDYQSWDIDGDGITARTEFMRGFTNRGGELGAWDTDKNGQLSNTEFASGVFSRYDEDGDQQIEEPELADLGDDMGDEGFWDA